MQPFSTPVETGGTVIGHSPPDCYQVLGVARDASEAEIKGAYAAILRQLREKIAAGHGDPVLLASARAAFGMLSDAQRRKAYDESLGPAPQAPPPSSAPSSPETPAASPTRIDFLVRARRKLTSAWKPSWFLKRRAFTYLACAAGVILAALATIAAVYLGFPGAELPKPDYVPTSKEQGLFLAAQRGDPNQVKSLLNAGVNASVAADPGPRNKGWTALHYAAGGTHFDKSGKHLEVAKLLLAGGADVNAKAASGYTPLHVAAGFGQVELARWLLDNGADIHVRDTRGSPLEAAVRQGHEPVVALLLERKASVAGVFRTFDSLETYRPSHTLILRRLSETGADVNEVDRDGFTLIDYLTRRGEEPVLLLLTHGVDLSAGKPDRFVRIGFFVDAGYRKVLEHLFSKGVDPRMRGADGRSLMHYAVGAGAKMLEFLYEKGVLYYEPDGKGDYPMHYAVRQEKAESVAWLLKMKVSPDVEGANGATPLMEAAKLGGRGLRIVQLLQDSGASMSKRDQKGLGPLDYAVQTSGESVELFLKIGAKANAADDEGYVALHRATRVDAAQALLNSGASVHARTGSGKTPLHMALDADVIRLLIAKGADITAVDQDDMTPLHTAAQENPGAVEVLVRAGAALNVRDRYGRTAMHYAAERDARAVQTLLKAGADLNVLDRNGDSPLHYAARQNNAYLIREMVKLGANDKVKNLDGKTALDLASATAHKNVKKTFDSNAVKQ